MPNVTVTPDAASALRNGQCPNCGSYDIHFDLDELSANPQQITPGVDDERDYPQECGTCEAKWVWGESITWVPPEVFSVA